MLRWNHAELFLISVWHLSTTVINSWIIIWLKWTYMAWSATCTIGRGSKSAVASRTRCSWTPQFSTAGLKLTNVNDILVRLLSKTEAGNRTERELSKLKACSCIITQTVRPWPTFLLYRGQHIWHFPYTALNDKISHNLPLKTDIVPTLRRR